MTVKTSEYVKMANLIKQAERRFENAKRSVKRNASRRTLANLMVAELEMWAVWEMSMELSKA